MHQMIQRFADATRKRSSYRRTLTELNAMSLHTAIDLGLFHEDFRKMAHEVVYGR